MKNSTRNQDLLELVDSVYEIVELFNATTPAQIAWKKRWLKKAKELGAGPDW